MLYLLPSDYIGTVIGVGRRRIQTLEHKLAFVIWTAQGTY